MTLKPIVSGLVVGGLLLYLWQSQQDEAPAGDGGALDDLADSITSAYYSIAGFDMTNSNLQAFLALIRVAEGTSGPNGYRTLFGGGLFDGFADHPRRAVTARSGNQTISSTAAGAYQFLSRTWDDVAAKLGLADFSPESQDLAAVELIRRRGALRDVYAGRLDVALSKCNREWASLPGSPYGQPTISQDRAAQLFAQAGGDLSYA